MKTRIRPTGRLLPRRRPMTGKRYGYARVSTDDQDLTIQREQLVRHGCDAVLFEKASGKSREGRPELEKIMSVIGKSDALVVTKFDRLGRNMLDMLMISEELKTKGANRLAGRADRHLDRDGQRVLSDHRHFRRDGARSHPRAPARRYRAG
jgi:Resolvase, N terminal domain